MQSKVHLSFKILIPLVFAFSICFFFSMCLAGSQASLVAGVCLTPVTLGAGILIAKLIRMQEKENLSAALLLCVLLIEYWLFALFIKQPPTGTYVLLFVTEIIRVVTTLYLLRYLAGKGSISTPWNIFLVKWLFIDCLFTFLVGAGPKRVLLPLHPLQYSALMANAYMQLLAVALYGCTFYKKRPQ